MTSATTSASTTVSATATTVAAIPTADVSRLTIGTVEVGLVGIPFVVVGSALDDNSLTLGLGAASFGALLFENGLARQLDAVAFDGEDLHEDLVAFLQFV